jgi:hypothetical protein
MPVARSRGENGPAALLGMSDVQGGLAKERFAGLELQRE